MITGALLQFLYTLINFVVGFLPVVAFPAGITTAWTTIWGYINAMSFLFPVATLIQVLSISILFHITVWAWNMGHAVLRILRGR